MLNSRQTMKINNVLVVYANPKNKEEESALELVKCTLKKYKISYEAAHRGKPSKKLFQNKDLVIAVGGDGTFLKASHFIFDKTPMLGVNSDPRYKEGFFMVANKKDFERKFKKVLSNNYEIKKFQRLEAYVNNKKVPELALNEFYVASEKPYHGRASAKCCLINGILNKNEKIEIVFELGNGVLIADSLSEEHKFKVRQKVTVKMSKKPLHAVSF